MLDRDRLRLSTVLLITGSVIAIVGGLLHPHQANPNDYTAAFAEVSHSASYTAIHLVEFVGAMVTIAGLLVLFFALDISERGPRLLSALGIAATAVALALAGVQFAVDGVALKQAADAWSNASSSQQAAYFVGAKAIRWLEFATTSYQNFLYGLALVLLGSLITWTARVPRPIGYLMALWGITWLVQGWLIGAEGYPAALIIPKDLGYVLFVSMLIWLCFVAWRRKESPNLARA